MKTKKQAKVTKKTQDRNDEVEKNNEEAKETVENKNDNENDFFLFWRSLYGEQP